MRQNTRDSAHNTAAHHAAYNAAIVRSVNRRGANKGRLNDLRTPGLLAQRPIIGVVMVLLGMGVFGLMVVNLQTNGPLIPLDISVANTLHGVALRSGPLIVDMMIFGFYLGEHIIVVIGVLLAIYFVYKRYWPELAMVVIAWAGEGAIWLNTSNYFNRPRPTFSQAVWHTMTVPSFPSGHVFAAVMCFGLLAYWAMPHLTSRLSKTLVWVAAVAIILFIGYSRLFVGDHYLTDVIAGYALGIAWFGLVFTTVELITQKGKKQREQEK